MSVSPIGFASAYRRAREAPPTPLELSDLLALVGYDARPRVIETWPLDKQIEAYVYAVNVHLRASDNVILRCPRPEWMPEPWQGQEQGEGIFAGPGGTVVP